MAFSKLTKIILWVVAGISLVVVLFFYASPKTLDFDELEARVEALQNPVDNTMPAMLPAPDTTATDSTDAAELATADGVDADAEMAADEPVESTAFAVPEVVDASELDLGEHLSGWEYLVWFRTDIALVWAYILVILTAIAALVFPLIAVFSNPRGLIRLVGVLVAGAILVVISYISASGTPIEIIGYTGTANSDPATLKMVDTTLFVVYILFGIALLSILYAIISRAFK